MTEVSVMCVACPTHPPVQHHELIPQHEQLNVFSKLAAPPPEQKLQSTTEGEMNEGEHHALMLAETATD